MDLYFILNFLKGITVGLVVNMILLISVDVAVAITGRRCQSVVVLSAIGIVNTLYYLRKVGEFQNDYSHGILNTLDIKQLLGVNLLVFCILMFMSIRSMLRNHRVQSEPIAQGPSHS